MSVGSIGGNSAGIMGLTQTQRQTQIQTQAKIQAQAGTSGVKDADGDYDGTAAAQKSGAALDVNG